MTRHTHNSSGTRCTRVVGEGFGFFFFFFFIVKQPAFTLKYGGPKASGIEVGEE